MASVNDIVGGNQVLNLRTADKKAESTDGVERFAPPSNSGEATQMTPQAFEKKLQEDAASKSSADKKDPLQKAGDALASFIPEEEQTPNTRLRINRDDTTGLFVYQSVDNDSGEVKRQFPAEEILKFLSYYREVEGLAVDDKA